MTKGVCVLFMWSNSITAIVVLIHNVKLFNCILRMPYLNHTLINRWSLGSVTMFIHHTMFHESFPAHLFGKKGVNIIEKKSFRLVFFVKLFFFTPMGHVSQRSGP